MEAGTLPKNEDDLRNLNKLKNENDPKNDKKLEMKTIW